MTEAISLETRRPLHRRLMHRGIKYDSYPEVLFAQALEERGIPFVPGALVVLGRQSSRPKVDFLLLYKGRALAVEIHGKAFHPANRMAVEWNRTRPLLLQGVRIDFVEAVDVLENPTLAVENVVELLLAA